MCVPPDATAQRNVQPPLNIDQVVQLWQGESRGILPKGRTRQQVQALGVDFPIETSQETRLRGAKMPPDLIEAIRAARRGAATARTGTLTVTCRPVECNVLLDGKDLGWTKGGTLVQSTAAGLWTVEVGADGFVPLTRTIEIEAGRNTRVPDFVLEPVAVPTGAVAITCEPSDCEVSLNGGVSGTTNAGKLLIRDLSPGIYEVGAKADGFRPALKSVGIVADQVSPLVILLEPDRSAFDLGSDIVKRAIAALGGETFLRDATKTQSLGRMFLTGDTPEVGTWRAQVTESYLMPNMLRWDLAIASTKWTVVTAAADVWSNGDNRYKGTAFGQELEDAIRILARTKLQSLVPTLESRFSVKGKTLNPAGFELTADSPDERYIIRTDKDYRPIQIVHESLVGRKLRTNVELAQYRANKEGVTLPLFVTLRFDDRPNHQHHFEFDRIDVKPQLKSNTFQRSVGLRERLRLAK